MKWKVVTTVLALCVVAGPSLSGAESSGIQGSEGSCADGVLILAHGGSAGWNELVEAAVDSTPSEIQVVVGFLNDTHGRSVQEAYDLLVAGGAHRIVAVPLMVSSHSGHMLEIEYLVGRRDELPVSADPPPENAHQRPHEGEHKLQPIIGPVPIIALADGLDDHPLLGEILLSRAQAMSQNPGEETVVLVAHGPNSDEDAVLWRENLDRLAALVEKRGGFRGVEARLLRDDALEAVRDAALAKLRAAVEMAATDGTALVVPVLVSKGHVVDQIPEILEGLEFEWTGDPLLPDPRVGQILLARAEDACTSSTSLQAKAFVDEIVVTGSRVQTRREDLPFTVDVVERQQLDRLQVTQVGDALKYVPGVTITDTGMAGQQRIVIRGVGGRRVLMLVDGERVTSQRDMSGPPVLSNVESIERVEVLKGPGSVMYGTDALGGVVNIITRNGSGAGNALGGSVGYLYSSASDLSQPKVSLQGSTPGWDYRLGWTQVESGDRKTPSGTLEDTSYENEEMSLALGKTLGLAGRLALNAERYRATDVEVYTGSPMLDFVLPRWDRDRVSLGYRGSGLGADEFSLKGYWMSIDKEFVNSITFPVSPVTSMNILNTFNSESEIFGLDSFGQWFLPSGSLLVGVDARREAAVGPSTRTTTMFGPMGEIPLGAESFVPVDAAQTGAAAFGEFTKPLSRGELRLGLRYDWVKTTNNLDGDRREASSLTDNAVTGSIGLRHGIGERLDLVASLATGFRSPNLQERYYESPTHAGGGLTYGDPNLDAERSIQLEAGLRGRTRRIEYRVTGFANRIDNMIATVRVPNPDIPDIFDFRYTNIDDALIIGFEGETNIVLTDYLKAILWVAYTRGTDRVEDDPIFVPPLSAMFSLRTDRRIFSVPVWAQLDLRWMDDQDRVPYQYLPNGDRDHELEAELSSEAYVTVDLAVGFDITLGRDVSTRFTIRGNNLLDEDYEEPFTSVPQAGRHVVASVGLFF